MPESPEQIARRQTDADLAIAGWVVQDGEDMDPSVGRGIAVREFAMASGFGFADYLLYLDRKALGAVEAKAEGTLSSVEAQSAKYAAGLPARLPAHRRPLPFLFESNGAVTYFTNGRATRWTSSWTIVHRSRASMRLPCWSWPRLPWRLTLRLLSKRLLLCASSSMRVCHGSWRER